MNFDLQEVTSQIPVLPQNPLRSVAGASGAEESAWIAGYKKELDDARARISAFPHMDPADILPVISGIAGRIAEVRADLMRVNTPRCARLRTSEVDPLREDLDFQFRIWSRKIALLEWEFKISGGGV